MATPRLSILRSRATWTLLATVGLWLWRRFSPKQEPMSKAEEKQRRKKLIREAR